MCILLLHHKCHLSSANTNGQRSITMISNCELSCHWVGYPKVHNMCLYISSPWIQGRDSRMWPVSGLQGYKEKDPITWPLSGLQGLYTPKRWFAWSSRQDRPNQVTMAPKRESYDSGVVFVSDPRLHFAWLVGWTAELVQHSGYDGHAHTLRTQFNYWHPAAPYDWLQTIEDCGPLIHLIVIKLAKDSKWVTSPC
jgi:hypothetical protein